MLTKVKKDKQELGFYVRADKYCGDPCDVIEILLWDNDDRCPRNGWNAPTTDLRCRLYRSKELVIVPREWAYFGLYHVDKNDAFRMHQTLDRLYKAISKKCAYDAEIGDFIEATAQTLDVQYWFVPSEPVCGLYRDVSWRRLEIASLKADLRNRVAKLRAEATLEIAAQRSALAPAAE